MKIKKYIPNNMLYRFKKGEALEDICERFNTTINSIEKQSIGELHEGEFIKIVDTNQFCHTVKPLESLTEIANLYGVAIEEIKKRNNLTGNRLFIGQKLRF